MSDVKKYRTLKPTQQSIYDSVPAVARSSPLEHTGGEALKLSAELRRPSRARVVDTNARSQKRSGAGERHLGAAAL